VVVPTLVLAIVASVAVTSRNSLPLSFVPLDLVYVVVFAMFSKTFFHTRHLMSAEFWYVIVVALGLVWLWDALRSVMGRTGSLRSVALGACIVVLVLNPVQIALPTTSTDPNMPISEDFMHDMTAVQAFMVGHAEPGDGLISTIYGLYATWEETPPFRTVKRITSNTSREDIVNLVGEVEVGWIVIDRIRLDLSGLSVRTITNMPQMEYIGLFGDEYVWRFR